MKQFTAFLILYLGLFFLASAQQTASPLPSSRPQGSFQLDIPTSITHSAPRLGNTQKLDPVLAGLAREATNKQAIVWPANIRADYCLKQNDIMVQVLLDAQADLPATEATLQQIGFLQTAAFRNRRSGWISPLGLSDLQHIDAVIGVRAVPKISSQAGLIANGADFGMFSQRVREGTRLVDGSGIRIGIISTSYNVLGGEAQSILNGELPGPGNPDGFLTPVQVLIEGDTNFINANSLDEGRAMAEVIHDVAPGAELFFVGATSNDDVVFADGVQVLVDSGCQIIVDDISLSDAIHPVYQDDFWAQRIDDVVTNDDVLYFTSAGNDGDGNVTGLRQYYQRSFSPLNVNFGNTPTVLHDLSDDPVNPDPFLQINFDNANASIQLITQWDEPWATYCNGCPGFATPIDLFVFDTDFGFLGRIQPQFPGDAVVTFGIDQASLAEDSILIAFGFINSGQTAPNLIRFTFQGNQARVISPDFSFGGPTVKGHNNARHAISVGATSWYNTPGGAQYWNDELAGTLLSNNVEFPVITIPLSPVPSFAGGPSVLPFQTASGLGGQEILFDNNGNRLPQAETRDNPSITAPDASQTSFFGAAFNFLPGVAPWFYGTSCSAPNAAAAAALLLQASGNSLTPLEMRNLLIATATDMDNPYDNGLQTDSSDPLFATGYDLGSGHGLIDADAAIEDIVASQGIEAIGLEASCRIQVNGSTEGRFLLSNPNPFGVEITLNGWSSIRLAGETTGQAGSRTLVIGPGETEVFVGLLFGAYASLSLNWQYQAPGVFYSGFAISSKFGGWEDCSSYNGSKTSDPLTRSQLKVFPNPAKAGRLTVEYELEQSDAANLRFFDQQGRIVLQQPQSLMAGQNQFEINTSGLAPGVYILSLLGNETDLSERIVIQ